MDLNEDPQYYSERGLNSIEILAYMAMAYSTTGNETYYHVFQELAWGEPEYYLNALNSKLDRPHEDNHSDNQLHFLAYHIMFYAVDRLADAQDPSLLARRARLQGMLQPFVASVWRWFNIVRREHSPLWLGVAALAARTQGRMAAGIDHGVATTLFTKRDVEAARENLRLWVIDMVQWGYDTTPGAPGLRWDVVQSPYLSRDGKTPIMRDILPPQERVLSHWNSDPYYMAAQGGGTTEFAPCEWTLPYWLMVYYGVLEV